jgi:hypothetical protein
MASQATGYACSIFGQMYFSMNNVNSIHIVTVGSDFSMVKGLWSRIEKKSKHRFSHIVLPRYTCRDRPDSALQPNIHYFRQDPRQAMPESDREFLASLEREGVPSVHNMILGDPIVSKINYQEALRFATFLARRFIGLYGELKPSAVIGGFDCLHNGLGLAVARSLSIPWYALNFSVIPAGLACFCERMSPNSQVLLDACPPETLHDFADKLLRRFEGKHLEAPAYISPPTLSITGKILSVPRRMRALVRTTKNAQLRKHLQFTEHRNTYSVTAVLGFYRRSARARKAAFALPTVKVPPKAPYVLFGLHLQPESSIDVWAPFFSHQMWVIELLSRSIPPTHKLLVKIHKSDFANYSPKQFRKMCAFPGVEIVAPFADTRDFIQSADLLVTIQGTMGLEGALLGRPVIILGDSPVIKFPSASRVGAIADLPELVRRKLAVPPPSRAEIVDAYASYLAPFSPASDNNWTAVKSDLEIEGYVNLFNALARYLHRRAREAHEVTV